jgi:hypothetical protein
VPKTVVAALLPPPSPHQEDNFFFILLKSAIHAAVAADLLKAAQGSIAITIDLGEFAHTKALYVPKEFLESHPRQQQGACRGAFAQVLNLVLQGFVR